MRIIQIIEFCSRQIESNGDAGSNEISWRNFDRWWRTVRRAGRVVLIKIWKATCVRRDKRLFVRDAAVVRRQLTSEVLHGAGLNHFMRTLVARGGGSRGEEDGDEGTLARSRALRRIRATAPRSTTRLHNRYPAYTCASHECTPVYEREKKGT